MARRARMELGDGTYHVTSRGNRRQVIFADDGDRRFFVVLLARITRQYDWSLHSYCLLDTHYHLVLESTQPRLSAGMRRLNGTYAQDSTRATDSMDTSFRSGSTRGLSRQTVISANSSDMSP
jgi:putative transposase